MSASSDPELLRRLISYEREHAREVAELVEPTDEGTLVLSPSIDLLWSANYVEVESSSQDASGLAELADRLLGPRGYRHRHVVPTDADHSARLDPEFVEIGWTPNRSVYMVLSRAPHRGGAPAVEVSREETEPIRRAVRSRRADMTPGSVDQMLVWDARLDEVAAGRWFAAALDGVPASSCVLYERGGVGQVESVSTDPKAEGRGLASGAVLAAIEASRAAGHELTFIVADADDWPWRLYERLGFERVGVASSFLRKPPSGSN
jgi:GNAT superfamily N-acetyltransferase